MEPKSLFLIVALVLLIVGAASANNNDHDKIQITLDDGCQSDCGDGVRIPYPFGIGTSSKTFKNCFLEEEFKQFELTCINSTLYWAKIFPVTGINITQGKLDMMFFVSKVCYNSSYGSDRTSGNVPWLAIYAPSFTISSDDNKFISVGCDTFGTLNSFYDGKGYSTGCLTRCYSNNPPNISDGNCSGIGCCRVDVPPKMRNISMLTSSFENFKRSLGFNNCSYSFVVKNGNYTFSKDHLEILPFKTTPVVFDWAIGNETCGESQNRGTNVCKGNSTCVDSDTGFGYRCQCNQGYDGNPYHPNGCTDIDECKSGKHTCTSEYNCNNTLGSYNCFCPKGQSGNGTKECHKDNAVSKYVIGASAGFIALFVAISMLFLMYQKRKLIKLKEKFFKQNGGFMLLQQLSASRVESSQTTQIFTADELKKATNNYDEKLIIGKGGYGTVFKGFLSDNRVVAIKKSKIVDDANQIEQFINEVIVLSQINHRNVVKLLGCCLETEVPLLVYEFVSNGSLFEFIHNGRGTNGSSSWKTHLRIAAEAAGALSYLHSYASIPIIHRDVKSANILLDENHTAKVADFGASRLASSLDQSAVATMVQGTFGYLDPEYMQTSQLTDKSDVYSFGVVLVELLTGEKSISFDRSEDKRSLAIYFLSCLKEDRLFDILQVGLLNEENKQDIEEVAMLAAKCLRLKGEERPSMKEVGMELEGIRLMQKHLWINNGDKNNTEETQSLLPQSTSKIYEHGESSSHHNTGYDSIRDQVLIAFDDGR